ncbi:uncharacterized protein LOC142550219 [Primulina tabacum]|uniref:uncharacterized protein LOC142550219 n=1 Tax=Primulina tabacum TaxID=48773 RepID=UPI003F5AC7BC
MYRELKRNFWWNGMKRDVAVFVSKCQVCQQVKAEHQRPRGLLQPLEIPEWKWDHISMDFVVGFPKSRQVGEKAVVGPELVQITVDKVAVVREKLKAAQDRQKSWADLKRRPVEFNVGEKAYVKVSPMKGVVRFSKAGKLNPRYVGPFEILEKVGTLAYRLALPPNMSRIHNVFHVSQLRKYISDPSHVLEVEPLIIESNLGEELKYEEVPIRVVDTKNQVLRRRIIPYVKDFRELALSVCEEAKRCCSPTTKLGFEIPVQEFPLFTFSTISKFYVDTVRIQLDTGGNPNYDMTLIRWGYNRSGLAPLEE